MDEPIRSEPAPSSYLQKCGVIATLVLLLLSTSILNPTPVHAAWYDGLKNIPFIGQFFAADKAAPASTEKSQAEIIADITKQTEETLKQMRKNEILKNVDIDTLKDASGLSAWIYTTASGQSESFSKQAAKQSFKLLANDGVMYPKSIQMSMGKGDKLSQQVTLPEKKSYVLSGFIKLPSGKVTISYTPASGTPVTQTISTSDDWHTISLFIRPTAAGEKGTISIKADDQSSVVLNMISLNPLGPVRDDAPAVSSQTAQNHHDALYKPPAYMLKNGTWTIVQQQRSPQKSSVLTGATDKIYIRTFVSTETLDANIGRSEGNTQYYYIKVVGGVTMLKNAGLSKDLQVMEDVQSYRETPAGGCIISGLGFFPMEFCHQYRRDDADRPLVIVYKIKGFPPMGLAYTMNGTLNIAIRAVSSTTSSVAHEVAHALGFDAHYDDSYTISRNDVNGRPYESPLYLTDVMGYGGEFGQHLIQTLNRSGFDANDQLVIGPFPQEFPRKLRLFAPDSTGNMVPLTTGSYKVYAGKDLGMLSGYGDHYPFSIVDIESTVVARGTIGGGGRDYIDLGNAPLTYTNLLTVQMQSGGKTKSYFGWLDTSEANLLVWNNPDSDWNINLEEDVPFRSKILWPRADVPIIKGVHFPLKAIVNTKELKDYQFVYAPKANPVDGRAIVPAEANIPRSGVLFNTATLNVPLLVSNPDQFIVGLMLTKFDGSTEWVTEPVSAISDSCIFLSKDQCLGPVCTWKDDCGLCSFVGTHAGNQCPTKYCGQFSNATSCHQSRSDGLACTWNPFCDTCVAGSFSEEQLQRQCGTAPKLDIIKVFGGVQPNDIFSPDR